MLFRQKKDTLPKTWTQNPEFSNKLKIRHKAGRPEINEDQPFLFKAIVDIALCGSAAHDKKRGDIYQCQIS